jgi:hypothetical protein
VSTALTMSVMRRCCSAVCAGAASQSTCDWVGADSLSVRRLSVPCARSAAERPLLPRRGISVARPGRDPQSPATLFIRPVKVADTSHDSSQSVRHLNASVNCDLGVGLAISVETLDRPSTVPVNTSYVAPLNARCVQGLSRPRVLPCELPGEDLVRADHPPKGRSSAWRSPTAGFAVASGALYRTEDLLPSAP